MDHPGLLELIAAIHDTVADPAGWRGVLEALSRETRSTVAVLQTFDPCSRQVRPIAAVGFDAPMADAYARRWAHVNPWFIRSARFMRAGTVRRGEQAVEEGELIRSEFFEGFLEPIDAFHALNAVLLVERQLTAHVSLVRSRRVGTYDEAAGRLLERLVPHMQAAVHTAARLEELGAGREALLDSLEGAPAGLLVLDHAGRLVEANRRGRRLTGAGGPFRLETDGTLRARDGAADRRLGRLIGGALSTASGQEGTAGGALQLRGAGGEVLGASVAPAVGAAPGGRVLILVRESRPQPAPDPETLARLYRLTPAEARVGSLLAGGADLPGLCARLDISANTARTHLKRLFAKTGTGRQAELVRLLLGTVPGPHLHG